MAVLMGYDGRVVLAGQVMRANKWSVDYSVETEDMTSTQGAQSSTAQRVDASAYKFNTKYAIPKVCDISATIEAFYDTVAVNQNGVERITNWIVAGHSVQPGKEYPLQLYPSKTVLPGAYWHFEKFLITQITMTVEVRGIVRMVFSGKNNHPDYNIIFL